MDRKLTIFSAGAVFALAFSLLCGRVFYASHSFIQYQKNLKELKYLKEAALLSDCMYREETPVSTLTIAEMLKQIDIFLPQYFPNGPYTREDFVAMAWLESSFNQYETGTHGERGVFQIMPDEFDTKIRTANKYNIDVNTKMCMKVLQGKYQQFPDYKKAIIAYNGVVIMKNGKWSEKYFKSFEKRKFLVDALLNPQKN